MSLGMGPLSPGRKRRGMGPILLNLLDYSPTWWGDASDADTIDLIGPDVSIMEDKSGNGNRFIASNLPLYNIAAQNGLNTIQFNGFSEFMKCVNNFVSTDTDTWFFVFQADNDGDNDATLLSDYGDTSFKLLLFRSDNDSGQDIFFARDVNFDILELNDTLTTSYSYIIATRTPGNITLNYNGNFQTTSGIYLSTKYDGGPPPHIGVQSGWPAGTLPDTYLKGNFCEGACFPGIRSAEFRSALANYAVEKWSIAA